MKNILDEIISKFNTSDERMCESDAYQNKLLRQNCKVIKE